MKASLQWRSRAHTAWAEGRGRLGRVSAARILAAAFGIGAGLFGLEQMLRLTPAVTAATPVVLALILLSALTHDSQQGQAAQQPESPPPSGRWSGQHVEVQHGQD